MLATSALSPGEKIWFKNRTLLDYLPLAIFPCYAAKTKAFQLAKALLKGAHSDYHLLVREGARRGPASAAHWIPCGHVSTSYLLS